MCHLRQNTLSDIIFEDFVTIWQIFNSIRIDWNMNTKMNTLKILPEIHNANCILDIVQIDKNLYDRTRWMTRHFWNIQQYVIGGLILVYFYNIIPFYNVSW